MSSPEMSPHNMLLSLFSPSPLYSLPPSSLPPLSTPSPPLSSLPPLPSPLFSPSLRDARNMARDVQATLLQVLEQHGNMTNQAASEYVKKLQKRGRYLQDVWS